MASKGYLLCPTLNTALHDECVRGSYALVLEGQFKQNYTFPFVEETEPQTTFRKYFTTGV